MSRDGTNPTQARRVRERFEPDVPALIHPGWQASHPWLVQGTTTRGAPGRSFDLRLFGGDGPPPEARPNWGRLLAVTAMAGAVVAEQVHGADVRIHTKRRVGLRPGGTADGHATAVTDVLLAVTVADCVPVFIIDPSRRAIALLHAGWRGAAAGILERGLGALAEQVASDPGDLQVHLGPAICGDCYEVGPEVFSALGHPAPRVARPLDLRAVLAARALTTGVRPERVTISEHCTRCTRSGMFSHRHGDPGRQVGYLGVRP